MPKYTDEDIRNGLQNLKLESMTRYIMVNFVLCLGREAT